MENAIKNQEILRESLLPTIRKLYRNKEMIFQHDGASCYTARTTKKWLQDHRIEVLAWPSGP